MLKMWWGNLAYPTLETRLVPCLLYFLDWQDIQGVSRWTYKLSAMYAITYTSALVRVTQAYPAFFSIRDNYWISIVCDPAIFPQCSLAEQARENWQNKIIVHLTLLKRQVLTKAIFQRCGERFSKSLASVCIVSGSLKIITLYPSRILRVSHCEAGYPSFPVKARQLQLQKGFATDAHQSSVLRDIWNIVRDDLLLLTCIVLTAVAAAFLHLQTPIVTGNLINVISAGIHSASSSGLGLLNKPALQLFALLTGQGKELNTGKLEQRTHPSPLFGHC